MKMKYIVRIIIAILCFTAGLFVCGLCKNMILSYQLAHPVIDELNYEDSLKVKVLQTGDTIAYNKLKDVMKEGGFPHKIWFYSIVMSKQYHYSPASYDVYKNVNDVYNQRIGEREIDMKTRRFISCFVTNDTIKGKSGDSDLREECRRESISITPPNM